MTWEPPRDGRQQRGEDCALEPRAFLLHHGVPHPGLLAAVDAGRPRRIHRQDVTVRRLLRERDERGLGLALDAPEQRRVPFRRQRGALTGHVDELEFLVVGAGRSLGLG